MHVSVCLDIKLSICWTTFQSPSNTMNLRTAIYSHLGFFLCFCVVTESVNCATQQLSICIQKGIKNTALSSTANSSRTQRSTTTTALY